MVCILCQSHHVVCSCGCHSEEQLIYIFEKALLFDHERVSVKCGPGGGGWRMADGGWRMADGGWRMADGGWRMADRKMRIEKCG